MLYKTYISIERRRLMGPHDRRICMCRTSKSARTSFSESPLHLLTRVEAEGDGDGLVSWHVECKQIKTTVTATVTGPGALSNGPHRIC